MNRTTSKLKLPLWGKNIKNNRNMYLSVGIKYKLFSIRCFIGGNL